MSAARLDAFSARLHAIHLKNARAKPAEPTLQEESAPEGATTGMPVREEGVQRLFGDEGRGSMSHFPAGDEGQGSMSHASVDDDDDESPLPGHSASNIPRGYHEPESPRDDTDDANPSDHAPVSGHRPVSGWGEAAPRRRAQDEDTQDQIRELRRRVEELENETHGLKAALNRLTRPRYGLMDN